MGEMGREKTRPQVIAISAKRTIRDHPTCRRFLDRPQERVALDDKHWVVWSSKSFRLYRSQPCTLRIFFSKRMPPSSAWKKNLSTLLRERLGVAFSPRGVVGKENYLEVPLPNPRLVLAVLNHRVANFLD
jgi:hypothetical protein